MQNGKFNTTDTALAAYLITLGYKYDIDKSNPSKVSYEFTQHNIKEFEEFVRTWETHMAEGNINQFYRTYRGLLNQIKS